MPRLTLKQRLQWWQNTAAFYRLAWSGQVQALAAERRRLTARVGFWKTVAVVSWGLALGVLLAWGVAVLGRP